MPVNWSLLEHKDRLGIVSDNVLRAACLEEQDFVGEIFRETIRQDASCSSSSDNDVVVDLVGGKKNLDNNLDKLDIIDKVSNEFRNSKTKKPCSHGIC